MYIQVINGELVLYGNFPFGGYTKQIELDFNEYENNKDKYIFNGEDIVVDPDYEEKEKEKEAKRISQLQITKRVLVLILQELGVTTWEELKAKIESNPQAQLEWDLCVELKRDNPLIDSIGGQLGLSPKQIDYIFRYANGEIPNLGGNNG